MSGGKHLEKDELERYLSLVLKENEERLEIVNNDIDSNIRLNNLITEVNKRTREQVVVLIDEYNAPLLDVVHDEKKTRSTSKCNA